VSRFLIYLAKWGDGAARNRTCGHLVIEALISCQRSVVQSKQMVSLYSLTVSMSITH
jgi:hypothetical protein